MTTTRPSAHSASTPSPGTGSPVVVGLDGSPASRAALAWAASEATTLGRPLHLLHAHPVQVEWPATPMTMTMPPVPPSAPADNHLLVEAIADLDDSLAVTTASVGGSAAEFLVDASATAALVVVGAPRHGALGSAVAGSTSVHVAAHAHCPVVVVPDGLPVTTRRRGVVAGADGSDASYSAVEEAFRRADRLALPLTVVHVWHIDYAGPTFALSDVEFDRRRLGERERALTAEAVARFAERYPDVVVKQEIVHGDPVKVLTDASADAEVVVVGSHGRGEVTGLLFGSVSQGLLRHAGCPVMVVRPGAGERLTPTGTSPQ